MKATTLLNVLLFVFGAQLLSAQELDEFFSKSNDFFGSYVQNGLVDYKSIKGSPEELNGLLNLSSEVTISKGDVKNYQAFWINAYNLYVIKGIVDNYPVKSPLDINGFFDKTTHHIAGQNITLNDIENKLLRGNFPEEARFHFVLVCAGLGCPPIINEAYLPESLENQLQKQTELALNNAEFVRVKGKKVLFSQIFEWYNGDFTQGGKSEIDFVNQYRKEKLSPNAKTGYYPYDWTLNEIK